MPPFETTLPAPISTPILDGISALGTKRKAESSVVRLLFSAEISSTTQQSLPERGSPDRPSDRRVLRTARTSRPEVIRETGGNREFSTYPRERVLLRRLARAEPRIRRTRPECNAIPLPHS